MITAKIGAEIRLSDVYFGETLFYLYDYIEKSLLIN